MPQELKQVNGRWVVTGAQQSSDLVPVVPTQRTVTAPAAARPTPAGKPKMKATRPWWSKLLNDVQYEAVGRSRDAGRKALRDAKAGGLAQTIAADTVLGIGGGGIRQAALGVVGAADNALKMGYTLALKNRRPGPVDPSSGRFGAGLDQAVEGAYRLLKAKLPSQMTQDERNADQFRRSIALNVALIPASPGLGLANVARMAGAAPWLVRTIGAATKFGTNEALSNYLDDNRGGNPINAINSLTGLTLPGAVDVGKADMLDAANQSLLPNMAASAGLGAAVGLGIAAGGKAINKFANIRRSVRAAREVAREQRHRARQEAMGVLQKDEADGLDFTPTVRQPPEPAPPPREPSFAEMDAEMAQRYGFATDQAAASTASAAGEIEQIFDGMGKALTAGLDDTVWEGLQGRGAMRSDPIVQNLQKVQGLIGRPLDREEALALARGAYAKAGPGPVRAEHWVAQLQEQFGLAAPAKAPAAPKPIPTIEDATPETFAKARDPMRPLPDTDPAIDPWIDDPAYQDWLRRNASTQIVPVRPPVAPQPPVELPRFPLPPQDDLRGQGLADPWGMGPDPNSPVQGWLAGRAGRSPQMETRPEAAAPDAGAGPDPDAISYDPSLPESTTISKVVEELGDQELLTVVRNPGVPVIERLNQVLEARQGLDTPPPLDARMVMAPTDKLAEDYLQSAVGKLQGREPWQLRPLFDPDTNPDLWRRAQALSGVDDPAQLTKSDMVETLQAWAAEGGRIPIVNRMMGAQMLPTAEITQAPQVFQYKGGVNEAGEQLGNSLSGVERWDPNAEGIIQVWRDGAGEIGDAGKVYVVNGHNRLAAAQRMGIPSMRVEFLDAPTAAEARLQGAISNVSDGKGTVFDAAKLAREYGITDPAQLKALGKPGASGFWKDGIAMGRLPEDVFTAAVNEQIPLRRAVIIGESGADEETMRSAYRYLVQQGPENVKEGTLREMLAMAKRSPAASSVDQPDILTGTEWAQNFNAGMLAKADLAAAVRLMLSKEKKLFGTVGRQAGQIERVGQVDAGAAKNISGEASRALALFDQLKYETGPVGDLLNEGTQRVLAGQSAADVAKGIKNRLAASIAEAMGKEVGPVTDAVQEDMFAAATRAADEPTAAPPVELTQAERDALEAQLIHEAAFNGEVRPPSTPIPDLPDPPQVRLDEINPDEPLTPGSKAAQAVADEFRLQLEHARMDGAMRQAQQEAVRDATNYELLTFEQRKALGLVEGVDEVTPTEVMRRDEAPSIADLFAEQARQLAESDARLYRRAGETISNLRQLVDQLDDSVPAAPAPARKLTKAQQEILDTLARGEKLFNPEQRLAAIRPLLDQGLIGKRVLRDRFGETMGAEYFLKEQPPAPAPAPALAPAPARPTPIRLTEPPPQPELLLPQDLRKAAPRYGSNTVTFQSDLDRAAYILANDAVKPSRAAVKFRQVVQEAGLNIDEVVAHGLRVKAALKRAAKGNPGQIELPPQPWGRVGPTGAARPIRRPGGALNLDELDGLLAKAEHIQAASNELDELLAKAEAIRAELNPSGRIPELIAAWRKVVGDDVRIRVLNSYKVDLKSEQWGGDGQELADIAGVYTQWNDTIHIWRQMRSGMEGAAPDVLSFNELLRNGFHESFHRIVRMAMSSKDMSVLNTRMARFKAAMAMDEWGAERSTIAYDELLTEAAAKVFVARYNNADPIKAILNDFFEGIDTGKAIPTWIRNTITEVVGALNKVYDFIEKSINFFQGRGFESISSVFEKAARGEMSTRDPRLGVKRVITAASGTEEMLADAGVSRIPLRLRGPDKLQPITAYAGDHNYKVSIWEDFSWDGKPASSFTKGLEMEMSNLDAQRRVFDAPPTQASINRSQQKINDLDQQIAENRRKAQQEGC